MMVKPNSNQKIKLTMLTTSFPLGPGSTSGTFVAQLVNHLPPDIHTTVLTPCADFDLDPPSLGDNHRVRCFRYAPRKWQTVAHKPGGIMTALRSSRRSAALLPAFLASMFFACLRQCTRSDLIHANWSVNGVVAGVAGRMFKVPVVTTLRGSDVNSIAQSSSLAAAAKLCLALSRQVVCVSEEMCGQMAQRFPQYRTKLTAISNGVDADLLNLQAERPTRPGAIVRILTVGNLTRAKGVHVLLKALHRLPDPVDLVIVGDGPERPELEILAEQLGLSHRIHFTGSLPQNEVFQWLHRADLFVLASRSEGKPNVVLEAMGAALPVIASRIDGVTELIEHDQNGLLFGVDNIEELVEQLSRLVRDANLRVRLGGGGRDHIIANELTWNNTAARYVELYQSVLAGR